MAAVTPGGLVVANIPEPTQRVVFVDERGCAVVWCACGCDAWVYAPEGTQNWRIYAEGHGPEWGCLGANESRGRRYER